MSVTYEVWDLGRGKWKGDVVAQSEEPEHVEAALMKVARKHLMSQDIDFNGDNFSGTFTVGGIREVGRYRKKVIPAIIHPPAPITLNNMTKEERSLLLFFETAATDNYGKLDVRHMNSDDMAIADRWNESGFVRFGRVKSKDIVKNAHWCFLSDAAWDLAHQERRARAKRMGQYGENL